MFGCIPGAFAVLTGAAQLWRFGQARSALIVFGGQDEQRDDDVPVSPPRRRAAAPPRGRSG